MGTTKSRKSRRNNSRPTAYTFLSNIALGSENEKPPDDEDIRQSISFNDSFYPTQDGLVHHIGASSLHSSDSSFSDEQQQADIQTTIPTDSHGRFNTTAAPPFITSTPFDIRKNTKFSPPKRNNSLYDEEDHYHHKLTRQDSERPIASEKIKKKSNHAEKEHGPTGMSIMSVFRYYTDKIRHSSNKKKDSLTNRSYVQQQLESHDGHRHRRAHSYAHFLNTTGSLLDDETLEENLTPSSYDPFFLDDDSYGKYSYPSSVGNSNLKRELNEQFRLAHPEIPVEITLSKIRSIKLHLLEIGKEMDLEVSSVAHAYVYFEKLVVANMVTKKNRKLVAACCLYLATKVNEAKGTWFRPLLDAMDDELDVDREEIHEHEFAVFADLEFNLYVPRREFMPHFERIFQHLEFKSIQDYLGPHASFYNTGL